MQLEFGESAASIRVRLLIKCGFCNGNPFGVRGQRGERKIQGRQKMCRDRGSNPGLRIWPPAP